MLRPIRAEHGPGYDINFVLNQAWQPQADGVAARGAPGVAQRRPGRWSWSTTEPGLQFYEGIRLAPSQEADENEPHLPYRGLCLEPQRFPDLINRPALLNRGAAGRTRPIGS